MSEVWAILAAVVAALAGVLGLTTYRAGRRAAQGEQAERARREYEDMLRTRERMRQEEERHAQDVRTADDDELDERLRKYIRR